MTNWVQKIAISAAVVAAGLAASAGAHAQNVSWSVGFGAPGVAVGVSNAPYYPVYNQPVYSGYPAQYYAPQPVYVRPAPVYVRPAPVYVQPVPVGWGHRHHARPYYPGPYYRY